MIMNHEGKGDLTDFSCTWVLCGLDYGGLSNMNKSPILFVVIAVLILQNHCYLYLTYISQNYFLCLGNLSLNIFLKLEF